MNKTTAAMKWYVDISAVWGEKIVDMAMSGVFTIWTLVFSKRRVTVENEGLEAEEADVRKPKVGDISLHDSVEEPQASHIPAIQSRLKDGVDDLGLDLDVKWSYPISIDTILRRFVIVSTVLAEDLPSLTSVDTSRLYAVRRSLTDFLIGLDAISSKESSSDLIDRMRSDVSLAQLYITTAISDKTVFDSRQSQNWNFTAKEIALLKIFDQYKSLDNLNVDEIAEEVSQHKRSLVVQMVFGNVGIMDAAQVWLLSNSRDIRAELISAFQVRFLARFQKTKRAIAKIDTRDLLPALWDFPAIDDVIKRMPLETLIAESGSFDVDLSTIAQSRLLGDLSPNEISAIGAFNNPVFASEYRNFIEHIKESGRLGDFERLILKMRDSRSKDREQQRDAIQQTYELFIQAIRSMKDIEAAN